MALCGFLWHAAKAGIEKAFGDSEWAEKEFNEALDSMQKPAFSETGEVLSDIGDTISDAINGIFHNK